MSKCSICSHPRAKEINIRILTGRQIVETATEFGINRGNLYSHMRKHIPWRSDRAKKPETVEEKLVELEYEFARLRVLAESGVKVGEALRVLIAQRNLFELLLRKEGGLDAHHKKLILNAHPPAGDVEVTFQRGRVKAVEVGK
jgi:hypothetical protein